MDASTYVCLTGTGSLSNFLQIEQMADVHLEMMHRSYADV